MKLKSLLNEKYLGFGNQGKKPVHEAADRATIGLQIIEDIEEMQTKLEDVRNALTSTTEFRQTLKDSEMTIKRIEHALAVLDEKCKGLILPDDPGPMRIDTRSTKDIDLWIPGADDSYDKEDDANYIQQSLKNAGVPSKVTVSIDEFYVNLENSNDLDKAKEVIQDLGYEYKEKDR